MYIIEVYDQEEKKAFVKDLDFGSKRPAALTNKKTEAVQWKERNQAIMYMTKVITDSYFGVIPQLLFIGFKVIKLK
jgi:hypothetical protein